MQQPCAFRLRRAEAAAVQHAPARGARSAISLEEEERLEAKDTSLDQLLSKLGGSITGTRVLISPPPVRASLRDGAPHWWQGCVLITRGD